jgi:hypothetical protein
MGEEEGGVEKLSHLKHGAFGRGFMLCDRCVLNAKCEVHVPGGECAIERESYESLTSELMAEYELRGLGDEICASRAAMYLIRVARVEVYEAQLGVSSDSVLLGKYIADLDKMLRVYLRELCVTRSSQRILSRNDVLADVDDLLNAVAKKAKVRARISRRETNMQCILRDWTVEWGRLEISARRR